MPLTVACLDHAILFSDYVDSQRGVSAATLALCHLRGETVEVRLRADEYNWLSVFDEQWHEIPRLRSG